MLSVIPQTDGWDGSKMSVNVQDSVIAQVAVFFSFSVKATRQENVIWREPHKDALKDFKGMLMIFIKHQMHRHQ